MKPIQELITNNRLATSLVFLSVFTIYLSLAPTAAETRPVITLGLTLFLFFATKWDSKISKDRIYCLLLIVALLAYGFISSMIYGSSALLETFKYIFGPLVYLVMSNRVSIYDRRVFLIILAFFAAYLLFFFLGIINVFSFMYSSRVEYRPTFWTAEPSYFSFFLMYYVLSVDIYLARIAKLHAVTQSYRYYRDIKLLQYCKYAVLAMGLLSGSAYVFIVTLIYLFILFLYSHSKLSTKVLVILLALSMIGGAIMLVPEGRASMVLTSLFNLLSQRESLYHVLIYAEPSGSARIIMNFLAFTSPFMDNFWGYGIGGFKFHWLQLAYEWNIPVLEHEVLDGLGERVAQTYFANLVADLGIFSLILFGVIFSGNVRFSSLNSYGKVFYLYASFCIFFMMIFQCQVTNPVFWLAIAMMKERNWHSYVKYQLYVKPPE